MTSGILLSLILLPWCGVGWLLLRRDRPGSRTVTMACITTLVAAGSLGLAIADVPTTINLQSLSELTDAVSIGSRLSWSADRFSLVMVAALMVIATATLLLRAPEDPGTALLPMIFLALMPLWWWTDSVWALMGLNVVTAGVSHLIPMDERPRGSLTAARTVWLFSATGDALLVMALVAGAAGLGSAAVAHYADPTGVHEFATMRPATAMFITLWSWLALLIRVCQFPFCVHFDQLAAFPRRGWVLGIGLGVFALAHRWADLHRGWWAGAPAMTHLILSAGLLSALFCAWFAVSSEDLRIRVAYLLAAQFSLMLGPLTTGGEFERIWAAMVLLGTLSLAVWLWSVVISPESNSPMDSETRPAWTQLLSGHRAVNFAASTSTTPYNELTTEIPAGARGLARLAAVLWCGLTISVGSWWWEAEPIVEPASTVSTTEDAAITLEASTTPLRVRPEGRLWVSTLAVMLIALAVVRGIWSVRTSNVVDTSLLRYGFTLGLCCAPVPAIALLAHSDGPQWELATRCSPMLAGIGVATMVAGGFTARQSRPIHHERGGVLAVITHMGRNRLSIPQGLDFVVAFPLRGLAQLFRFLNDTLVERGCESVWRDLPDALRALHRELHSENKPSQALMLLMSGVALVTTLVWLAHAGS